MKKIPFTKYHGLGNDFIIIDRLKGGNRTEDFGRLAREICRRNFGVGADGVLVLTRSKTVNCRMDVYNSDGSWAEKSGNGLRIAAAYYHASYSSKKRVSILTGSEVCVAEIVGGEGGSPLVTVSLGSPVFETRVVPIKSRYLFHINRPIIVDGISLRATAVSVGNPHTVIFVNGFDFDWKTLGGRIENARIFVKRTNVEFVKIVNKRKAVLNDWERGAGATGSSGTGAAATVAAGVVNGFLKRKAEIVFPSGSLHVEWREADDTLYLTGPVNLVCRGEYYPTDN